MLIRTMLLAALLGGVMRAGCCAQPSTGLTEQFKQYPAIEAPQAKEFVRKGLAYAVELYGQPATPVTTVILRYRPPRPFTNTTDPKDGSFTIFLSRQPNEYAFFGQLAHEVAHLLNAIMFDAYVEGLNTVFAERLILRNSMDWRGWEQWFAGGNDPFYGATYAMMKEVAALAGDDAMHDMLRHAKQQPDAPDKMYIDVDEWLRWMPAEKRGKVRAAILRHAARVQAQLKALPESYSFVLPR